MDWQVASYHRRPALADSRGFAPADRMGWQAASDYTHSGTAPDSGKAAGMGWVADREQPVADRAAGMGSRRGGAGIELPLSCHAHRGGGLSAFVPTAQEGESECQGAHQQADECQGQTAGPVVLVVAIGILPVRAGRIPLRGLAVVIQDRNCHNLIAISAQLRAVGCLLINAL